jgi:nucleolar MIF4G domain-containing protein 1
MLETLSNLKNNKLRKTGGAGASGGAEALDRMSKFLAGLARRRSSASLLLAWFTA